MSINSRISQVLSRIHTATQTALRDPASVQLIAVSKTQPAEAVRAAYTAGLRHVGESYLQDALPKIIALADLDIVWHFIGPIQSNKTRAIAENFNWVHSVDREKIAQRLNQQRPDSLPPLQVCIQVNISEETNKAGVRPEQVDALANFISTCHRLTLRGLMAIPQASDNHAIQLAAFNKLAKLKNDLIAKGYTLDTLSMGMSTDLEAAIEAGATFIRIGTAIFGDRNN